MGNIIKAKCTSCDFEKDFNYGGNMMDFTTNNPVPALHKISGKFKNVNYFKEKDNAHYHYYFEDQLTISFRKLLGESTSASAPIFKICVFNS